MKKLSIVLVLTLLSACQPPESVSLPTPSPLTSIAPVASINPMPSITPTVTPMASVQSTPVASPSVSATATPEPIANFGSKNYSGVIYSDISTPLEEATVIFIPDLSLLNPDIANTPAIPEYKTQTNAKGEYSLDIPDNWNYAMEIIVQKEGHVTRRKFFRQRSCCGLTLLSRDRGILPFDERSTETQFPFDFGRNPQGGFTTESMLIPIEKSALLEMSGRVSSSLGDSIPGALVYLKDASGKVIDTTSSRHDGSYLFAEIEPNQTVTVSTSKPGYTLDVLKVIDLRTQNQPLDFQLDTISWQGQTLAENGKPLENVKLTVSAPHPTHPVNLTLFTSNNGQFSFIAPPNLDLNITASNGTDILKITFKGKTPEDASSPVLLVLRALEWKGLVLDTLRRPVANAEVWAKSLDGSRPFEQKVKTDGEGKYTIKAPILDTPIELVASHPDFMAKKIRRTESSAGELLSQKFEFGTDENQITALIPLDKLTQSLTSLSGVVRTADGPAAGRPIAGAVLHIKNTKGFEDTTVTGMDGTYILPSLPAGVDTYTLTVTYNNGKQEKQLPIEDQKRRVADLDFNF